MSILLTYVKILKNLLSTLDLVCTPDQYVVLASNRQDVIDNSIKTLETHQQLCQMLGIDTLCIHVGSKDNEKILYNTFEDMSDSLKRPLCFENDDKCNNVSKTLAKSLPIFSTSIHIQSRLHILTIKRHTELETATLAGGHKLNEKPIPIDNREVAHRPIVIDG